MITKRIIAETFGTFWLVFGGCGAAVLAAAFPQMGIGFEGVSLAFGLTVITMAYAIGPVSGCHLNPAVSIGLATAGRFSWKDVPFYVAAQVLGAILAAGVLLYIAQAQPGFDVNVNGLAANGYDTASPGGFALNVVVFTEALSTFFFLFTVTGAPSP